MKMVKDQKIREAMKKFKEGIASHQDIELVPGKVLFIPSLNRISVISSSGGVEVYNNPKLSIVVEAVKASISSGENN